MSGLNMADRIAALGWLGAWFGSVTLYMRWTARRARRAAAAERRAMQRALARYEVAP